MERNCPGCLYTSCADACDCGSTPEMLESFLTEPMERQRGCVRRIVVTAGSSRVARFQPRPRAAKACISFITPFLNSLCSGIGLGGSRNDPGGCVRTQESIFLLNPMQLNRCLTGGGFSMGCQLETYNTFSVALIVPISAGCTHSTHLTALRDWQTARAAPKRLQRSQHRHVDTFNTMGVQLTPASSAFH